MRVAQVAPLFENVPPSGYGGTERVISILTDGLTWAGHEVTLFATRDSHPDAEIIPCRDSPIGAGSGDSSEGADHIMELDTVLKHADEFDIIHFHTRFQHFPMFEHIASRTVTTCHNRVDFETLPAFFRRFRDFPLVSISDAQRAGSPHANWAATIPHGYPVDQYDYYGADAADPDGHLVFLGRICPEKGILDAIEIAERAGRPLKIAARINATDEEYWQEQVRPRVDGRRIEYVGELQEQEKSEFLNRAAALLFPIRWPEPFGLVMIEAMACGLPTIAYPKGSVPEVLEDGITGAVVDGIETAVSAVERIEEIDRTHVRKRFEARFSAEVMVDRYADLYRRLAQSRQTARHPSASAIRDRLGLTARRDTDLEGPPVAFDDGMADRPRGEGPGR